MNTTSSTKQVRERDSSKAAVGKIFTTIWGIIRDLFDHVLAEPYREGKLRSRGWPTGLKAIVSIAIIGYCLAIAGVIFSGWIRESLPLYVTVGATIHSFPRPVLWVILFLVVFSISLLQSAALHISAWLAWVVTALSVVILLFVGSFDSSTLFSPARLVSIIASVALIAFVWVRLRSRFKWWEFVVVLALITTVFSVGVWRAAVVAAPSGVDFAPGMLSLIMFEIGQLAIPAAIAAGLAVAEISASTAIWTVGLIRRRLPAIALVIGFVLILVWRIWSFYSDAMNGSLPAWSQVLSSIVLLIVIIGIWFACCKLRSRVGEPLEVRTVIDRLGNLDIPIAVCFSITLVPVVVGLLFVQIVVAYGVKYESTAWLRDAIAVISSSTTFGSLRVVIGALMVITALVLARRGSKLLPEILATVGLVSSTLGLAGVFGLNNWIWTTSGLTLIVTVAGIGLTIWYGLRRTLHSSRIAGLAVLLLLAAFIDNRDFVSDPLGALLGFAGAALVLFGFIWSFLTDNDFANNHSRKYPRPARVLIYLANSVFGVTVLAFTSLSRNPDASINLGDFASLGDQLLGTSLMAAAVLAVSVDIFKIRQSLTQ